MQMTSNLTTRLRHNAALAWTCLAITMKADAASEKILFDFQTATHSPRLANRQRRRHGRRVHQPFSDSHQRRRGFQRRGVAGEQRRVCFRALIAGARESQRAAKPSCCAFAATAAATNSPCAPSRASTRRFTNAPSPRSAASGRSIGCAFKDFVPTFRGRVLTDVPPLESGEGHVGGLPDFRKAGWAISTGGGVDQGVATRGQMSMNILVTGASGFIGAALVSRLAEGGHRDHAAAPGAEGRRSRANLES